MEPNPLGCSMPLLYSDRCDARPKIKRVGDDADSCAGRMGEPRGSDGRLQPSVSSRGLG